MNSNNISPSLEDYLEVILELNLKDNAIRVTDLAQKLQVAKSSVNQAVKKLVEMGLLKHEHYGPIELTEHGLVAAEKITHRHQLLKRFFIEILGVDSKTAEEDACHIEHYISSVTMKRLLVYLKKTLGS